MVNEWEDKEVRISVKGSVYGPLAVTLISSTELTRKWRAITHVETGYAISPYFFSVENGRWSSLKKAVEEIVETLDWNLSNVSDFRKKRAAYAAKIEQIIKKYGVKIRD